MSAIWPPSVGSITNRDTVAGLPPKPTAFSLSRIGLPLKPTNPTPLKRSMAALDDEDTSDRKLQKLDLPDFDPEVQSGDAAQVGSIGADLAVADGDEDDDTVVKKEEEKEEKMDIDKKAEEDEEEDPLDAFMRDNVQQVVEVNKADAKRMGLRVAEDGSDDENQGQVVEKDKLAEAEALLQCVSFFSKPKSICLQLIEDKLRLNHARKIFLPLTIPRSTMNLSARLFTYRLLKYWRWMRKRLS